MKGKTLVVTTSDRPDFAAMTAGKAMFAVVGAFAMISAGNKLIRENNVEDPAHYIGSELAGFLSQANALKYSSAVKATPTDDIGELIKQSDGADYILDVRTINWSFAYFPTDWDNYRVIYSAKLRFYDAKSETLLAEGFCSRVPEQTPESPSRDELLADHASRLKQELQISAEECLKKFKTDVLAI